MDVHSSLVVCFDEMLQYITGPTGRPSQPWIFLLDARTITIVSAVVSQSTLLKKGIYLVDLIHNIQRQEMHHMQCICFLCPSQNVIENLSAELKEPKYASYVLFFSNSVDKHTLDMLASSDQEGLVKSVKETSADFIAVNSNLFSLNNAYDADIWGHDPDQWDTIAVEQTSQRLVAALLALRKLPAIRFGAQNKMAHALASRVDQILKSRAEMYDFKQSDIMPILLILDRRGDPFTPLLTQWTYQAMIHECLGIKEGRVSLPIDHHSSKSDDFMLVPEQDEFFKKNMYVNFGELGSNVQAFVTQFHRKSELTSGMESISDFKKFVEEYPEYKQLSGAVRKHVDVISELSRRVELDGLLEASELEQSIVCHDDHSIDAKNLRSLLNSPKVVASCKLRLVALYAIRYHSHPNNQLSSFEKSLYSDPLFPPKRRRLISDLLQYCNSSARHSKAPHGLNEVIESTSTFLGNKSRSLGMKGVDNIFTQHIPQLERILQDLVKSRLRESDYPFLSTTHSSINQRPQDIIVFVIGGTTYQEARVISELNTACPGVRIVLGSTTVLNSSTFCDDVQNAVRSWGSA